MDEKCRANPGIFLGQRLEEPSLRRDANVTRRVPPLLQKIDGFIAAIFISPSFSNARPRRVFYAGLGGPLASSGSSFTTQKIDGFIPAIFL